MLGLKKMDPSAFSPFNGLPADLRQTGNGSSRIREPLRRRRELVGSSILFAVKRIDLKSGLAMPSQALRAVTLYTDS